MLNQLLLAKRVYGEAARFAEKSDSVSCGLSISLLQDAAEMLVWALVKKRSVSVKDLSPFTTNLDLLEKDGVVIAQKAKLLELNKARVGFKHYGNLPDPSEAQKFKNYVEDFLRDATQDYFSIKFDDLSLIDLVPYPDVQARLKDAEAHISAGEFNKAVVETSIAKVQLFSLLGKHIPNVDHSVGSVDGVLARSGELRGVQVFGYIEQYLGMLREALLVSLLRVPFSDYSFLNSTLYRASKTMAGTWSTFDSKSVQLDEAICRRQVACLVDISTRIQPFV